MVPQHHPMLVGGRSTMYLAQTESHAGGTVSPPSDLSPGPPTTADAAPHLTWPPPQELFLETEK